MAHRRGGRKIRFVYASVVALLAAQIMCTPFGRDSSPDDGPDAVATEGGATNDGASEAGLEASTGRGCAGRDLTTSFCEDFDDEAGSQRFTPNKPHGTAKLDIPFEGGYSLPNAAHFVIPASSTDGATCGNEQNCEGATSNAAVALTIPTGKLRLAFRLLVMSSRVDRVFIFFASAPDLTIIFAIRDNQLEVNTSSKSDTGADVYGSPVKTPLGEMSKWIEIEVMESFSPPSIGLRVGGQMLNVPIPVGAVIASPSPSYTLQIGGDYHNAANRPFEVLIDDVIVEPMR